MTTVGTPVEFSKSPGVPACSCSPASVSSEMDIEIHVIYVFFSNIQYGICEKNISMF